MPGGKPGDHPINDILIHRLHLFGGGVDEEVFNIASEFGEPGIRKLKEFAKTPAFEHSAKVIQDNQMLLLRHLTDVWNELIIERRRNATNQP